MITENELLQQKAAAVLVGLELPTSSDFDHSMDEMKSLVEACDIEVVYVLTQKLSHPESGTYLGSGKIEELIRFVRETDAQYCIFEDNLSPAQLKNLQNEIGIEIWDRTMLILEIFSKRARTKEARLQVESAYLQYMLPRLTGMWQHLGRQGGGSGSMSNRGIGETQLELDRRQIKHRISELEKELDVISRTRAVQRQGRTKGTLPQVALVGYTNAGKSTILNKMLEACGTEEEKQVFQKDMLFATLDTSIRRICVDGNRDFLLSDTVGFIENLPHSLIKAFRSTLEEAINADLILVVLNAADPYHEQHRKVTEDTLIELSAENIPRLYVYNKSDLLPELSSSLPRIRKEEIWISAQENAGLQQLTEMIVQNVYQDNKLVTVLLPFQRGDLLNLLHTKANVLSEEYTAEGVILTADCPKLVLGQIQDYITH